MSPRADLVVHVADLLHRPGARRHEDLQAHLEGIAVAATLIEPIDDIDVDVTLEAVSEGILASGVVTADWHGECRRCLTGVAGVVQVDFRELFEPHAREGESYPLNRDEIDLEPLAREALLLELPLTPLCRVECRGICPSCGADLNEAPCDCDVVVRDPRWAALDDLRLGE